jgi:hypothetical protein
LFPQDFLIIKNGSLFVKYAYIHGYHDKKSMSASIKKASALLEGIPRRLKKGPFHVTDVSVFPVMQRDAPFQRRDADPVDFRRRRALSQPGRHLRHNRYPQAGRRQA